MSTALWAARAREAVITAAERIFIEEYEAYSS